MIDISTIANILFNMHKYDSVKCLDLTRYLKDDYVIAIHLLYISCLGEGIN